MKKLLLLAKPLSISIISILLISIFLRYYLLVNTQQLSKEFKLQNYREIYSSNTLEITSRLNSLSTVINWVCLEGSISGKKFYDMKKGSCETSFFQQRHQISLPEANDTILIFTLRLPREAEILFFFFMITQLASIVILIHATKKDEELKRLTEIKINKSARQMSHDIRSPLATLNTIINDLDKMPSDLLDLMQKSVKQINEISNKLLKEINNDYIYDSEVPQLTHVNLAKALDEIVFQKKIEYKEKTKISFELKTSANSEKMICLIDEIELKRSISNLLNNAAEAFVDGNHFKILIELSQQEGNAIISIKDSGMGIPLDILDKIGKSEITTKKSGNGLGLIHAMESVRNWNGSLDLKSEINRGTTIIITLPAIIKELTYVLLDNDELVRLTWIAKAKKNKVNLLTFTSSMELFAQLALLPHNTIFYIDSSLDNEKGEDVAQALYKKGYLELHMCTGHDRKYFESLNYIKSIRGKEFPI
jgi:signal transduction histidine kinase